MMNEKKKHCFCLYVSFYVFLVSRAFIEDIFVVFVHFPMLSKQCNDKKNDNHSAPSAGVLQNNRALPHGYMVV